MPSVQDVLNAIKAANEKLDTVHEDLTRVNTRLDERGMRDSTKPTPEPPKMEPKQPGERPPR